MLDRSPRESVSAAGLPDGLPRSSPRSPRLGLRAQLLVALSVLFAVSFALLTAASLQLSARSARLQARASAARLATLVAHRLSAVGDGNRLAQQRLLDAVAADLELAGVEYRMASGQMLRAGELDVPSGQQGRAEVDAGGQVLLSIRPAQNTTMAPLRKLLVFYAALTGGAALLLSFVLLTQLMVRPLERITSVSERLAAGDLSARAPVTGAAEVAVVSASLNRMADQLRRDRDDLQAQLEALQSTTQTLHRTEDQLAHGDKLASVGRLAAGVAHEVGNPLAAILGFVELLQAGNVDAAQRAEFLTRIHSEVERINGVVRGLLDFSRREPDVGAAVRAPIDLRAMASEAVALVRPLKAARSVQFDFAWQSGDVVAGDAPHPLALGEPGALRQVLVNLLINAVDAIAAGGPGEASEAAQAVAGRVTIDVQGAGGGHVCLSVRDSGSGIDPGLMPYLFEPFATTKPVGRGTGLGLAVAHGLVERMGGILSAENAPSGGACFRIELLAASGRSAPGPDGTIV